MTKNKVAFKHVNLVDRVEPARDPAVPYGGVLITVTTKNGTKVIDYNRRMNER